MGKLEYVFYYPKTGESQKWLVNPSHLNQACMWNMAENNQTVLLVKLSRPDESTYTVLVCIYEDKKFKFFTKETEI